MQEKNAGKVRYWLPVARFVQSGEAGSGHPFPHFRIDKLFKYFVHFGFFG